MKRGPTFGDLTVLVGKGKKRLGAKRPIYLGGETDRWQSKKKRRRNAIAPKGKQTRGSDGPLDSSSKEQTG